MTKTYTYTQTTDSKGHARFYRVDENGKRKVISRKEYEANTTEQVSMEAVKVETPATEAPATETAENETVMRYWKEDIEKARAEAVAGHKLLVLEFDAAADADLVSAMTPEQFAKAKADYDKRSVYGGWITISEDYTNEAVEPAAEPTEAPAETETCTALAVPFDLDAAVAELNERKALDSIKLSVPSIEETALDTVKAIIAGMEGKHSSKVRLQATKKGIQVRYRNCAVCALVFDAEHVLTGIRFTGTTMETVNEATVREPAGLSNYADEIVAQVMFIDWWWANCSKKSAA